MYSRFIVDMEHAHVCGNCDAITIFAVAALYPRRCSRCHQVVRLAPPLAVRSIASPLGVPLPNITLTRIAS
ncbi:MAG: hypothetical protein NVS3B20_07940 [Polyangiales bacterium]